MQEQEIGKLVYLLRNIPVRKIIQALERDDFYLKRSTRSGGHIYVHIDGRIVVIHYHHSNDTFKRKTLKSVLEGTLWNRNDLTRLQLI
ncbi:type II toxin-antitoxin system HicA family toxin [Patescibacteria group bacterium]